MTAAANGGRPKIVVIIPAWNEEGKIGPAVASVPAPVADRVVVVDDGSTDATGAHAAEKGAVVLRNERQRGVGASIRRGYGYALENNFDIAVVMAGNSKDDGREIPLLTGPIAAEEADLVQGSRYLKPTDRGPMPFYRVIATRFVHPILFSLFCGQRMTDTSNGFRAIRTSVLKDPRLRLDQPGMDAYEMENYLLFKAIRLGYRVIEAPVRKIYPDKSKGYTKMRPIIDWWKMLKPIFQLGLRLKQ